jgi:hypothetical protein
MVWLELGMKCVNNLARKCYEANILIMKWEDNIKLDIRETTLTIVGE